MHNFSVGRGGRAGGNAGRGTVEISGVALVLIAMALLAAGCGGRGNEKLAFPARTPKEPDKSQGATLSGTISWAGNAPKPVRIIMTDATCQNAHDRPVFDEKFVVTDGFLRDVFVHVVTGLEDWTFDWEKTPAVMDQRGCIYVPHVLGVRTYQPVEFRNSDTTTHNVNTSGSRMGQGWNKTTSTKGQKIVAQFQKPELMMPTVCNVHTWMQAFVCVVDHPYFAVSDARGRWSFPRKLPPGKYTIEARHPALKPQTMEVEVTGEGRTVDFEFSR